jgi:antidote-toxin recognition MazE-like antitoxin
LIGKMGPATEAEVAAGTRSKSSRDRTRAYRERLRQQGLRPIQIWVPDVRSPEFAAEARRQSLAVANSPQEKDDQEFIDAISDGNLARPNRKLDPLHPQL